MASFIHNKPVRVAAIGAIAIGALAVGFAWYAVGRANPDKFIADLGGVGLQAVMVGIVAVFVTAALEEAAAQRDERHRVTAYRLDLLRRLRSAYGDVKRARRELEGAGFRAGLPDPLPPEVMTVYRAAMEKLGDANLEIEAVQGELEAAMGDGAVSDEVARQLRIMETHQARAVFSEFLRALQVYRDTGRLTPAHVSAASGFAGGTTYWHRQSRPHRVAACLLVAEALAPGSPADTVARCRSKADRTLGWSDPEPLNIGSTQAPT